MDCNLYQGIGMLSYTAALISSSEIASWTYIIVAIVSMIAGIVSIVYNVYKAWKNDGKIDDTERKELMEQLSKLKEELDKIKKD